MMQIRTDRFLDNSRFRFDLNQFGKPFVGRLISHQHRPKRPLELFCVQCCAVSRIEEEPRAFT